MKKQIVVQILAMPFPWPVRRLAMTRLLGYRIEVGARIGRSIVCADRVELGEGAYIGSLNMIWKLHTLRLGQRARIGQLNYIYGYIGKEFFSHVGQRVSALEIGDDSAVTSRHLVDCTDRIKIGRFTTVAGYRSTVLTHSIDLECSVQSCKPIAIGDYCFVGTNCVLLGGVILPDRTVVAAGAVVAKVYEQSGTLLAGVPAKPIKELPDDWAYFKRPKGFVV